MMKFIVFCLGLIPMIFAFIICAVCELVGYYTPSVYVGAVLDWWVDFCFS